MADASQLTVQALGADEQDSILKSRLATDEKHLKRVTKRLSTLAQASSTDEQCVPFVLTGSDAMFQMLKVDLALFRANLGRLHTSAHATTERDVATYKAEAARLEACVEEQAAIARLKDELAAAQSAREQRLAYDVIARKIAVYPPLEEMEGALRKLEDRIAYLRGENEAYGQVAAESKSGLEAIVTQLETLSQSIGESLAHASESGAVMDDAPKETEPAASTPAALNPNVPSFTPHGRPSSDKPPATKRGHGTSFEAAHSAMASDQPDKKRARPRGAGS